MKLIRRETHLDRAAKVSGTPDIKAITSVRRCGNSKLLEAIEDRFLETDPDVNVIDVGLDSVEAESIGGYMDLYGRVEERYVPGWDNVVLIDEVQMCPSFEKAVNYLHAAEKYDIYITGSNAFLPASDLATLFTGRTVEISVYPFSFGEYMRYFGYSDASEAFDLYVRDGGMAGSYVYRDDETKSAYVRDVLRTIVQRDIRSKNRIKRPQVMRQIMDFMMDNISNLTSAENITAALRASGNADVNHSTVAKYMEYLCDAFVFYRVDRYDLRGKRYLANGSKYYLCDHAFRRAELGTRNEDLWRVYENMVAIELLRRGYEICVGALYRKEIDFVATRRSEKPYIQVSGNVSEKDTFDRETGPLLSLRDGYPRILIARTVREEYTYEGIRVVDISDRLLEE